MTVNIIIICKVLKLFAFCQSGLVFRLLQYMHEHYPMFIISFPVTVFHQNFLTSIEGVVLGGTYISNSKERYITHPVSVQVWLDNFH